MDPQIRLIEHKPESNPEDTKLDQLRKAMETLPKEKESKASAYQCDHHWMYGLEGCM